MPRMWLVLAPIGAMSDARAADLAVGPGQDYLTLNDALDAAAPGDHLVLTAGRFDEDVDLYGVDLEIIGAGSDPVTGTILAAGDGTSQVLVDDSTLALRGLVLDGGLSRRPLTVQNGSTVEAVDVAFVHGRADRGGGALIERGALTISASTFDDDHSTGQGGGLFVGVDGIATVEDTAFAAGTAVSDGGGAYVGVGGTLTVRRSTFDDHTASHGAGLACASATRCTI
ncbi:MAG: hypothetical protein ABMB14_25270, partial [Myxococcota bacterium]